MTNKFRKCTNTKLLVNELHLIALAIDVEPCEIFKEVCKNLKIRME